MSGILQPLLQDFEDFESSMNELNETGAACSVAPRTDPVWQSGRYIS